MILPFKHFFSEIGMMMMMMMMIENVADIMFSSSSNVLFYFSLQVCQDEKKLGQLQIPLTVKSLLISKGAPDAKTTRLD